MLKNTRPAAFDWRRALRILGMVVVFVAAMEGVTYVAHFVLHLSTLPTALAGQLAILAVALLFALLDGDGLRILGVTGPWKPYDIGIIAGLILLHYLGSMMAATLFLKAGLDIDEASQSARMLLESFGQYDAGSFFLFALALAALAGIGEELLFRGYLITRLEKMGLSAWGCIIVSALVFGLAHWPGYGFWSSLSKAIFFGIPTGAFFWYRRSLGPIIVAHALMDLTAFSLVFLAMKFV